MTSTTKPTKEAVRQVNEQHRKEKTPPLSPEEYRRKLGWFLLNNKCAECAR